MKHEISLLGRTYEVEVELAKPMEMGKFRTYAAAAPAVTGAGEAVNAPMPGNIRKVSVKAGDAVRADQVVESRGSAAAAGALPVVTG